MLMDITMDQEERERPLALRDGIDVTEPADTAEIAIVDVLAENRAMLRLLARETDIVSRTTGQGLTEAFLRARH